MRIDRAVECSGRIQDISRGISRNNRRPGQAKRGKGRVAPVSSPGTVGGHDAKMIRCARNQAADVRINTLVRVASLGLGSGCRSIAGRGAVLEINASGQSMRIE